MYNRKPSQAFVLGEPDESRVVLFGAGVVTDVLMFETEPGTLLRLRDGTSLAEGRVIFEYVGTVGMPGIPCTGMNLEFEQGLVVEWQTAVGSERALVAAYIQDRSPDAMSIQLARIADEMARLGLVNEKLAAFVKGLELGNPAT